MDQTAFAIPESLPGLLLVRKGFPVFLSEPVFNRLEHGNFSEARKDVQAASSSFLAFSKVSASETTLSLRHRRILGKRTAIPDLCLLDSEIPSKAISKT